MWVESWGVRVSLGGQGAPGHPGAPRVGISIFFVREAVPESSAQAEESLLAPAPL